MFVRCLRELANLIATAVGFAALLLILFAIAPERFPS